MKKFINKVFNLLGYQINKKSTYKELLTKLKDNEKIVWEQDFLNGNSQRSFSWEGEDILIERIIANNFNNKSTGFYVDVGAHHPLQLSNTYRLYLKGWRGINIDAMPGSMKEFIKYKPEDINLEVGISEKEQDLAFYTFEDKGMNGFLNEKDLESKKKWGQPPIAKEIIHVFPLEVILDKFVPKNIHVDLLNVDIETLDLQALKSNNWKKYRPSIIIVEDFHRGFETKSDINKYLSSRGYKLRSKLYFSSIYILKELEF